MLRRTPVLALAIALGLTALGLSPANATAPTVTSITATPATIYPSINTAKRPGSTDIVVTTDAGTPPDAIEVHAPVSDAVVKTFPGAATVTWNGRDDSGNLVPAGTYTVVASIGGVASGPTPQIEVSRQTLIRKSFTRTVTAARSLVTRSVGRCSTLRRPSLHKWAGSLGFYANTKCKTQTWKASRVVTVHASPLPAAESYADVAVNTYGGAARTAKRSRGLIEYFNPTSETVTASRFLPSRVGWHKGAVANGGLVTSDGYLIWTFASAFKSRYDVAKFTVVVHYDVLSAS